MKLVTKIATIATLASFMFAGMNINWGNTYADDGSGAMTAASSFGVHFDVNDNTTFGWEGGLMVGLAGPAGSTRYTNASESQSTSISLTFCVFPDSSPFIQSFFLDLLQNQELPVFFVSSNDSLFEYAKVRIFFVVIS